MSRTVGQVTDTICNGVFQALSVRHNMGTEEFQVMLRKTIEASVAQELQTCLNSYHKAESGRAGLLQDMKARAASILYDGNSTITMTRGEFVTAFMADEIDQMVNGRKGRVLGYCGLMVERAKANG